MTYFITATIFILFILYQIVQKYFILKRFFRKKRHGFTSVGFFHPYCNDGGGGERVLWCAVRAIQIRYSYAQCIIYTGDAVCGEDILKKVDLNLNIKLPRQVEFVHLKTRFLVEAKYYPYFTLLLQSLGSVILGLEAAFKHVPDIYIDTMGYAWTLPIFKHLAVSKVGAYVHYPTISTDMLSTIVERKSAVNNREFITKSYIFSGLKLIYYKIFAFLYTLMGKHAEIIMVNSNWTKNHILHLWKNPTCTYIVYPPCDVSHFESIPIVEKHSNKLRIISIAQFRPEKDHILQLKAFHEFLMRCNNLSITSNLVLIGSCRHAEDYARVDKLKEISSKLKITEKVEFKINLSFHEVIEEMTKADIAMHTMWNEHFGIGVVECMSAGLIMVAHDSGGPKLDIIQNDGPNKNGFLASSVDTYADALEMIKRMNSEELLQLKKNARNSVSRFSTSKFEERFLEAVEILFT